jgi:DUF305 family protein family protein
MLTAHHPGAIQMAQTELADGQNPDANALAQKIITGPAGRDHQDANPARELIPSRARRVMFLNLI